MKKGILKETAWGISPLGGNSIGGNSIEGTGPSNAPIRDLSTQEVPLVYDSRVGSFISEQSVDDLDDLDISVRRAKRWDRDQAWRAKAGIKTSIAPNQVHRLIDQ